MIPIGEQKQSGEFALFNLGFRPFFLLAGAFAVVAVALWMYAYLQGWQRPPYGLTAMAWHGHEMIFGYALAVIAGFLLTAVRNWTQVPTLHGLALLLLCLLWLVGRIMPLFPHVFPLELAALADGLFLVLLMAAVAVPIVKARKWQNLIVVAVLAALLAAQALFFLGALGEWDEGVRYGLYSGLYLIVLLIFIIGRRVMPFFIERGVGYPVTVVNRAWLDITTPGLFVLFWLSDLVWPDSPAVALLAGLLCLLHGLRLSGWYTPGIWRRPLLWVLFLAYAWLVVGFALKAAVYLVDSPPSLALHAFAYGGIGLMTLGMMARVAWGHTGRDIARPPALMSWAFALLFVGALIRVLLPLLLPALYGSWMVLSQVLWIAAFMLFCYVYAPILVKPRFGGTG